MRKKLFWLVLLVLVLGLVLLVSGKGEELYRDLTFDWSSATEAEKTVKRYADAHNISYGQYPQSLIELLERNPEAREFVLEYPLYVQGEYDLSETDRENGVPLLLQWDQRWGYLHYGSDVAGVTGCGPVCLSMAAFYLTKDEAFSPDRIIRFAADNGYYVKGSGSSWKLISEGGVKLGFDVRELPLDENLIRKNLEAGNPIITVVGPGDFTSSGHFLVMTGWEDGKILINDPNSTANSQKLSSYEEIKDQIKNLWAIRN